MRLHEFEAKALFRDYGIPVPDGEVADAADKARQIALRLGGRAVVKAQVLAGGRGKAGGVQVADSPEEAARYAEEMLGREICGCRAEGVLVEACLKIDRELYLGITLDGTTGRPVVVVSASGGVEIEAVAAAQSGAVVSTRVHPIAGLSETEAAGLIRGAGLAGDVARAALDVLCRLYRLFAACEATTAEINPLAATGEGGVVAADAVVEVDDAALFRHPEFHDISEARLTDARERAARAQGMTYVGLDGEIGLICSGAGLGMATMDLIAQRARPANFLETGGGITRELMAEAMRIVLGQPGLKGVLINIYGGINPIHEGAQGVADVMAEGVCVPVVAKALGNFQERTWAILEDAGVTVVKAVETERAVDEVLRQACGEPDVKGGV